MSDSPAAAPLVTAAGERRPLDARHLLGLFAALTVVNAVVGLAGGTLIRFRNDVFNLAGDRILAETLTLAAR